MSCPSDIKPSELAACLGLSVRHARRHVLAISQRYHERSGDVLGDTLALLAVAIVSKRADIIEDVLPEVCGVVLAQSKLVEALQRHLPEIEKALSCYRPASDR